MVRFKTKEFLSQTITAQVVFNLVFLYTETLLIAENVVAVYSDSLFASLSQQTSNMETKGKFRRVLKKRNVQFYSCRICMKVFGIVNDWTTMDKGVRDIVIEVISTHYYMISQQISKWAKKSSPRLPKADTRAEKYFCKTSTWHMNMSRLDSPVAVYPCRPSLR